MSGRNGTTPGYALVNLRTSYNWNNVRFDLGVENLFDKSTTRRSAGWPSAPWTAMTCIPCPASAARFMAA